MEYGNVTKEEYHRGIDALKWTLLEKKNKVKILKQSLVYAEKQVQDIETDLRQIIEMRPDI